MNTSRLARAAGALALVAGAGISQAQIATWDVCRPADPNTALHSNDFGVNGAANILMGVTIGGSGTTTYGGQNGFCFVPNGGAVTVNARGRYGFWIPGPGTVQSATDDGMALTFGMPGSPGGAWGYANILQSAPGTAPAFSLFGANGYETAFNGESDTYAYVQTVNNNVRIGARFDVIADAARIQWNLTNIGTSVQNIGLWTGHIVSLLSFTTGESRGGITGDESTSPSLSPPNAPIFVDVPGIRPPSTERRFRRSTDASAFPDQISFLYSQSDAVGMRINNTRTDATTDTADPTQSMTDADEVVIGQRFFLLGGLRGNDVNRMPDTIFQEPISDVGFLDTPAYIQKYNPTAVPPGSTRTIIQYVNSPWSDALYGRPYSVVADTPKVVNLSANDANAFEQNPFSLRVYVDNDRGFASVDRELPLEDVKITLNLPAGMTTVGTNIRTINRIEPRRIGFVDFQVQVDPTVSGDQGYSVTVQPSPGPTKTLNGVIRVVSQPRLPIRAGANLVSEPFVFNNPVWEEILGLTYDTDFQAFNWDPVQKGYVISTGPVRGFGTWIVSRADRGVVNLQSNPVKPPDALPSQGGAPLITLKQGWNLIGNPYPVSIQLGQIVGSANSNPSGAFTFGELVQQGIVSGSLAYYDQALQTYRFIQGDTGRLEPQKGYWIYVFTQQDVVLRYPPVFQTNYRSAPGSAWAQSDKQWRLQIAARGASASDDQNFIGVTTSSDAAKKSRVYEPPIAPTKGAISVAVSRNVDGANALLAQSLAEGGNRQTFDLKVESRDAGPVTLTWPNLSTIPKTMRVRLTDKATGQVSDLRKVSGYTFDAESRSIRDLSIQIEPGQTVRPVIGNVIVTRDSRAAGPNSPVTIAYSLGADATTSVRILSGSGREVYAVTRGRADRAGSNTVTWNLRDNANRAVAPGTYRVEILAEGDDGERVRKFAVVNVVR